MRLSFILFFSFISLISSAQDAVRVTGKCLDKKGKGLIAVKVSSDKGEPGTVYTDQFGVYEFYALKGDTLKVRYSLGEFTFDKTVIVPNERTLRLANIDFPIQQQDVVEVVVDKKDPFELPKLPKYDLQNIPMGSVERSLVYTTAATSNNELTSNYNVRGGNYDENLVYVNGFLIYRPFLTRSGQQEGMSFINSALVESIQFSAGGFNAQYGDKLSSVLDITYKTPTEFHGSAMASLLGVESHVEDAPTSRLNFLVGARYRSNGYLLNSLPTKGAYNPVFWDAQILTNYAINENLTWSLIGHLSSNNYRFSPQTQETDFGTANEAYSFRIYFDGQEQTRFQTMMGGTSLTWRPNEKNKYEWYATVFNTNEREYFDIQGQYYINELETDPSKEEYGDSIAVLGVGTFLNHARNKLNATIFNTYVQATHDVVSGFKDDDRTIFRSHSFNYGVNYQHDIFYDVLSEWKMVDSAGYSVPQNNDGKITLFETIKGELNLSNDRLTSFAQWNGTWSRNKKDLAIELAKKEKNGREKIDRVYRDTISESLAKLAYTIGVRAGYTAVNNELFVTPRASLIYYPRTYMVDKGKVVKRDLSFRIATGLYYQPPFYREMRTFTGGLNTSVLAQKSFHFVTGSDVYFKMWGRDVPFKFTAEAYYKYMWDVNPYEIENVRTRYYANNDAVAYAYGLDLNIHGEFVEGIESFFKLGVLSTKEDVLSDQYTEYYNAAGERIIFGYSEDQTVVDSAVIYPGFVPRPTDQMINFGALVQDRMPGFESFSVQMGMQYGAPLPYGPPDRDRYKDTLRMKGYFRVDIGMSYDFLYKKKDGPGFFQRKFSDAIISFEVFNLLGINNVLSKQWIQDVEGKYYSIPNYLTQRRFNLKLILRF